MNHFYNLYNEDTTPELKVMLEEDNHPKSFYRIKDWDLLSSLSIKKQKFKSVHILILDQELLYENSK